MLAPHRVYDCFTYDGEDCLDLRLRTHWSAVDVFVIVEAEITFAGQPKALSFDHKAHAWAAQKIRYIALGAGEFADCQSAWDRERLQRNALKRGYQDAADQDVVLIADVDEILRPEKIRPVALGEIHRFELLMLYFFCDYLQDSDPFWHKVVAVSGVLARQHEAEDLRNHKTLKNAYRVVNVADAGWHFSYLGGMDMVEKKLARFSHQNLNRPRYKDPVRNLARLRAGKDIYRRAKRWGRVDMGDFGQAEVADWFAQRPALFAPQDMRFAGPLSSVLSARRESGGRAGRWEKLLLRLWNAF